MSRCAVCGREGLARPLTIVRGDNLGNACPSECEALLWAAHFVKSTGGTEHELALVTWEWRYRRNTVEGKPLPPRPESPAEKCINTWIRTNGLEAIARELE